MCLSLFNFNWSVQLIVGVLQDDIFWKRSFLKSDIYILERIKHIIIIGSLNGKRHFWNSIGRINNIESPAISCYSFVLMGIIEVLGFGGTIGVSLACFIFVFFIPLLQVMNQRGHQICNCTALAITNNVKIVNTIQ